MHSIWVNESLPSIPKEFKNSSGRETRETENRPVPIRTWNPFQDVVYVARIAFLETEETDNIVLAQLPEPQQLPDKLDRYFTPVPAAGAIERKALHAERDL